MTPAEKAIKYAQQHLQDVRVCWLDRQTEIYDAVAAVELCSGYRVSRRIVGVVAQNKRLEAMMHQLLDKE